MKVEIIAEIANAHQGDRDIAIEIANKAINCGADAVKFQMYTADDLLAVSHSRYQHFKNQSFSKKDWEYIFSKIDFDSTKIYLDIFGLESFSISQNFNVFGYKIHFSDLMNEPLIKLLANTGKDILIGCGGAWIFEIDNALKIINEIGDSKVTLLHGFQAYPTKIKDTNLERLNYFKNCFGNKVKIGISDHIEGDNLFSKVLPMMALPYGIDIVEKHVTVNRADKGVDYYSSLDIKDFKDFTKDFRESEKAIGSSEIYSDDELNYRKTVKKKWFCNKDLDKGAIIREQDLVMKRDDTDLESLDFNEIVNQKINSDIKKDTLLKKSFFKPKVLAIVVARSSSSRLPGKASIDIVNEPSLVHLFKRLIVSKDRGLIDNIAFCTTNEKEDDTLVELLKSFDITIFRGETENVLKRMALAFNYHSDAEIILRVTGDDILIDPDYIKKSIHYHKDNNLDYTDSKLLPTGTEVEVIKTSVLKTILKYAEDLQGTEYLTNYITENNSIFKIGSLPVEEKHSKNYRLTLDTKKDYKVISALLNWCASKGKHYDYNLDDIVQFFEENKEYEKMNISIKQKSIPKKFSTRLIYEK
ncbi:N-acetylneuraminate synthase family protein [bacterium]|nr:N-acetylneuraminate synthase family protein [bacterium]